ncbi:MAG: Amt family ammonium transporter [Pseudomonadales bacterium]|jgi:Amt family ammonium transporter
MIRNISSKLAIGLALAIIPTLGWSEELNQANTAWILTSTALVLFMTIPGLALFYGGLVRSKNVLTILMQCFTITGVASILWFIVGYSLAFSEGGPWIGGLSNVLFASVTADSLSGNIPETTFAMFQMTFAIITPALVIGAFAERTKFSAVVLFTILWSLVVYAPVTHWVWGGGWLGEKGLLDFAGGVVVHVTAGVAALVCAIVIGARRGFPQQPMPPHNMTMTITGAGMLWVGWFGFNGGSALAADGAAGMAILVTHLSAAAGAIVWMSIEWVKYGKPSALGAVTGMVAGLGTITPASGFVGPAGGLLIGVSAGFVCFYATMFLQHTLKIDDSLDVFPVHGVGGALGTIMAGVLVSNELGVFSGMGLAEGMTISSQLMVQITGVVAVGAYTAVVTYILLKIIDRITGLRVTAEEETSGLDVEYHNERGYDL